MSDIAREMGVAPGTLYLYVTAKAALFDLVVRKGLGLLESDEIDTVLPIRSPSEGETLELLAQSLDSPVWWPKLDAALSKECAEEPRVELEAIIDELFDLMLNSRSGLLLLKRCARDWPELAEVYLGGLRRKLVEAISVYFERRAVAGQIRGVATHITAVYCVETIAWWVLERVQDPEYSKFSDDDARDVVKDQLVSGLLSRSADSRS